MRNAASTHAAVRSDRYFWQCALGPPICRLIKLRTGFRLSAPALFGEIIQRWSRR